MQEFRDAWDVFVRARLGTYDDIEVWTAETARMYTVERWAVQILYADELPSHSDWAEFVRLSRAAGSLALCCLVNRMRHWSDYTHAAVRYLDWRNPNYEL